MGTFAARVRAWGILAATVATASAASASAASAAGYAFNVHWHVVLQTSKKASSGYVGIAASGPRSAWALGFTRRTYYAMRWNGKTWHEMLLPKGFQGDAISGSSASDVWVIGTESPGPGDYVQETLHWNGRSWTPKLVGIGASAVVDVGRADVWVQAASGHLLHWDGASWSRYVYSYARSGVTETLAAVGQQVWRTESDVIAGRMHRLVIRRSTGSGWQEVRSPHPRIPSHGLAFITSSWAGNVWIEISNPGFHSVTLLHWNGKSWTTTYAPLRGYSQGYIAAVGRSAVWIANGAALWSQGKWHLSPDLGCGIPVGVPGTSAALCAGIGYVHSGLGPTYGTVSESGRLP